MSFQISISPSRRAAGRFIFAVRRALQRALQEEEKSRGVNQSSIAKIIGVHRSVINRELRGNKDLTLGRVAELAYALGREPTFALPPLTSDGRANVMAPSLTDTSSKEYELPAAQLRVTQTAL